jgi:hypothetical protein
MMACTPARISAFGILSVPSILVRVVRADHQHDGFGFDAVELAVLKTPEHVLGAVTAHAEVQALAVAVIIRPHSLAAPFPTLRDGIADECDVARAGIVWWRAVTLGSAAFAIVLHGDNGRIRARLNRRWRIRRHRCNCSRRT